MTAPMMIEPETATWPNAWMTSPAKPSPRTSRVDATLRPRRNSVATSSSDGNTEKSSGFLTNSVVRRITSASRMLQMIRKSSRNDGTGRISSRMMPTMKTGTASFGRSLRFMRAPLRVGCSCGVCGDGGPR